MIKQNGITNFKRISYWIAWIMILFSDITTGALRYGLQLIGFIELAYIPKILVLIVTLHSLFKWRQPFIILVFVIVLFYSSLIALFNNISIPQIAFGLTIFLPIIFGMQFWSYVRLEPVLFYKIALIALMVSCFGLLINVVNETMPWSGFEFVLDGKAIEGSREWAAAEGINRPSGFSRMSVAAAVHVMLMTLIVCPVIALKSRMISLVIGFVGLIFVTITTTKSAILALLLMLLLTALNSTKIFRITLYGVIFVSILLPITTVVIDYKIVPDDLVSQILLSSFDDRLSATWPIGLKSIVNNSIFGFGRGLSGVGTGEQLYGNYSNVLFGFSVMDNFALYLYGNFGFLGLFFLGLLMLSSVRLFESPFLLEKALGLSLGSILVFGFTTDAIENPVSGIFMGLAIGAVFADGKQRLL